MNEDLHFYLLPPNTILLIALDIIFMYSLKNKTNMKVIYFEFFSPRNKI